MAYTSFVPATFSEVLSQIAGYASGTLGWAASYDNGSSSLDEKAVITPRVGDATFTLRYEDNGSHGHRINCVAETAANVVSSPVTHIGGLSNVWLFAGETPEPWMHVVINSIPGQYHHLYFGFLQRYGVYDSGAVVTSTHWANSLTTRDSWGNSGNGSMMFSGGNGTGYGGVILEGPNPTIQRGTFCWPSHNPGTTYARLTGGVLQEDNRRLIRHGLPLHNAAAPMAPFLILADFEKDGYVVPIGTPPGIRMIHIDDFNPEQIITFGANDWQIFPLSDKARSTNYNYWPEYQNGEPTNHIVGGSQWMGIALLRA